MSKEGAAIHSTVLNPGTLFKGNEWYNPDDKNVQEKRKGQI